MLQAMAGHDPADPASANRADPRLPRGAAGRRQGAADRPRSAISTSATTRPTPRPGRRSTRPRRNSPTSAARCASVTLSPLADWAACGVTIMLAEAYAIHEDNLRARFTDYGEIFRDRMALAGLITAADYVQALRRRRELVDELDRAMADLDLVMTAAAPSEAPPIDAVPKFAIMRAAEPDDAVQRHRQPGDVGVLRLYRGGAAAVVPDRRQALRRRHRAARCPRLRAGDAVARDGGRSCEPDTPTPTLPRMQGRGLTRARVNSLPRWRGRVGVGAEQGGRP